MLELYKAFRMKSFMLMILSFFLITTSSYGKEIKMVTVNWPPYFGENLKGQGLVVKIIKASLKEKGHSLLVDYIPWKRAVNYTKKTSTYHALLGCFHTLEREKHYIFSSEIASAAFHFLFRNDLKSKIIRKPEDLIGLRIGVVRGYVFSKRLKDFIKQNDGFMKIKEVSRFNHAIRMLMKRKLDVVIENPLVARYEFKKAYPKKIFNLLDGGTDFSNEKNKLPGGLFICWSRKNKEALNLSKDFEEGFNKLRESGKYNKIKKEFGL